LSFVLFVLFHLTFVLFVLFYLTFVLFVLPRFTASDYLFGKQYKNSKYN
jgi:hypothetical protein